MKPWKLKFLKIVFTVLIFYVLDLQLNSCGLLRDGVTWLLFHRSIISNMRWKATVIVRLFEYMSHHNNFFSLKYVEPCAWKSCLHDLKVVILAWKTKNVLGSQKSLKMKNWNHYSMKIVSKHKKSSRNIWESLKQPFQNV